MRAPRGAGERPARRLPSTLVRLGPQHRTVLRNVDGVRRPAVTGAVRAMRMNEERKGESKRTEAVAFTDARTLYRDSADPGTPEGHGLYDPALAKDSCGVGFIADIKGRKSHQIVVDALTILVNLEHRGAVGADPRAGDGAGILVQIPHKFFARKAKALGITLPKPGEYGIGALFMPRDADRRELVRKTFEEVVAKEGLTILGWRSDMPVDNSTLGETVKPTEPFHMQVFIGKGKKNLSEDEFERRLYILRKSISATIYRQYERRLSGYYPVSISCRTVIYKGMFLADQLGTYYPDLSEPDFESALALVHQRFSTNTFPTWSLAHPYRMVAHNGEINTLRGNNNWMAARQASVSSKALRRRHLQALADLLRGPVRHRLLRQRARIPGAGRLPARARHDDDDPRGLGGQSADGRGAARLLRVQRGPDGAVGRPRRNRIHRRPADRRDARPQRPSPGALFRDARRPHHHGLRDGRAADPGKRHRHQVAAATRQDAAGRSRTGPPHSGRGTEGHAGAQPSLQAVPREHPDRAGGIAGHLPPPRRSPTSRCSIASRPSATRRRI